MNEPPPDVLERRTDVPLRLAAAVDRALEKDPARRFGSMDQFAWELRQCLAELDSPDAARTVIAAGGPVLGESAPRRVRTRRRRTPLLAVVALLAVAAIVAGAIFGLGGSKGNGSGTGGGGGGGGAASAAVSLHGVGDYDPQGNGGEHSSSAPLATDGNPSTAWSTEIYASPAFGGLKSGLGLVLDAGRPVKLSALTVSTSTPGFTARILAGDSPSGGFTPNSETRTASSTTTFPLNGKTARYYVVWITMLPPGNSARIEEVRAR